MAQAYSNPERETDPHALPDIEVFWHDGGEHLEKGWYWWSCFPGCLPDSDPYGPYETKAEALAAAREDVAESD